MLFGEKSSLGLQTSIDSMDVRMMAAKANLADNGKDSDALLFAHNYRESIHLQDLIMLTDMYSVPQLLTLLARSVLNENEIEY